MPAGAAPCDVIVELEIVAWLSVASIDRDCSISLKAAGAVRVGTRGGAGNSAGGGPARTARLARLSAPPMATGVALPADAALDAAASLQSAVSKSQYCEAVRG